MSNVCEKMCKVRKGVWIVYFEKDVIYHRKYEINICGYKIILILVGARKKGKTDYIIR